MPRRHVDPRHLGPEGRDMWDDLHSDDMTGDAELILLEACRCRDRLERYDQILRGDTDTWIEIEFDKNDHPVSLTVDKAASLAVSTQNMMKQLVACLRLPDQNGKAKGRAPRSSTGVYANKSNVSAIDRARSRGA